jgi:DNA modification methylase
VSWRIVEGECVEAMRQMPEASVDAVVCDPPYALAFMGKPWDAYDGREDAGFAYWLAGFIDGEGCFAIKGHSRGTYAPSFRVKLRADDRGILDGIRRTLGIGTVAEHAGSGGSERQASWTVGDRAGCQRLVDLLDKYPLRAKKRNDYLHWREAVCEWTERPRGNRWDGPSDQTRMSALRDALMEGRRYTEVPWSGHEFQDWCRLWAREALRVLKPGGHLLAFGGSRTYHRMASGIEDAGFEIRDCLAWIYGSGFPKSLDVSKAIDKAAGAEREVLRERTYDLRNEGGYSGGLNTTKPRSESAEITAPATPDAERWQGWGTALKPSHEPVVVARKPLAGTVAATVLAHGTGALNIDGCRIPTDPSDPVHTAVWTSRTSQFRDGGTGFLHGTTHDGDQRSAAPHEAGRWPANVILDEEAAAMLDAQTGELHSGANPTRRGSDKFRMAYGDFEGQRECEPASGAESGGASRFFYCAKTSSAERNAGLDGFERKSAGVHDDDAYVWPLNGDGSPRAKKVEPRANVHPTVKPIDLMRWLVRLVTPPGGTVLDPFTGSGTTGIACALERFEFVGIEREAEYAAIARARLAWWSEHPDGMELVRRLEAEREVKAKADAGQLDLFAVAPARSNGNGRL